MFERSEEVLSASSKDNELDVGDHIIADLVRVSCFSRSH